MLLVLLFLPGLLIGAAAGLRRWALLAGAPVVTFGVVGLVSPYADATWIRWNIATLAVVTVVVALLLVVLRFVGRDRPRLRLEWPSLIRPQATTTLVLASVAVSGGIGALVVWRASQRFQAFPQWWDTTFHANAIRFISDSGNADPAALRVINFPALESFYYPSAYHALSALVVRSTGVPIEAILNIADAISPFVFALGLAGLLIVVGCDKITAASVALMSGAAASALYDIMVWGPLFPYVLGTALIPAFLVALNSCVEPSRDLLRGPVVLALAGLGLIALHPGAAFAALLLAALLLLQKVIRRELDLWAVGRLGVAAVVLVLLGFPQLRGFLVGAGGASVDWPGVTPPAEAVGALLLQDHVRDHPQWWLLALALVGVLGIRRQRGVYFYLAGALVFAGLYVAAASYEGALVAESTRPWWNDQYRLLALATHGLILLAGFGIAEAARTARAGMTAASAFVRASPEGVPVRIARGIVTVTVLGIAVLLTNSLYLQANVDRVRQLYGSGPTVTDDKLAAYQELSRIVGPGTRVMNDPQDGSPWMWAYADVRPVFGHALMLPTETPSLSDDQRLLLENFARLDVDPAVRAAVARENVGYVVLANGFISSGLERASGLRDVAGSPSLTKIFENRDAVIYQVAGTAP